MPVLRLKLPALTLSHCLAALVCTALCAAHAVADDADDASSRIVYVSAQTQRIGTIHTSNYGMTPFPGAEKRSARFSSYSLDEMALSSSLTLESLIYAAHFDPEEGHWLLATSDGVLIWNEKDDAPSPLETPLPDDVWLVLEWAASADGRRLAGIYISEAAAMPAGRFERRAFVLDLRAGKFHDIDLPDDAPEDVSNATSAVWLDDDALAVQSNSSSHYVATVRPDGVSVADEPRPTPGTGKILHATGGRFLIERDGDLFWDDKLAVDLPDRVAHHAVLGDLLLAQSNSGDAVVHRLSRRETVARLAEERRIVAAMDEPDGGFKVIALCGERALCDVAD